MKLYTYFRAAELAKEFCVDYNHDSLPESWWNKYERRKRQRTTIRDGLIQRMERIEYQVVLLRGIKNELEEELRSLEHF